MLIHLVLCVYVTGQSRKINEAMMSYLIQVGMLFYQSILPNLIRHYTCILRAVCSDCDGNVKTTYLCSVSE